MPICGPELSSASAHTHPTSPRVSVTHGSLFSLQRTALKNGAPRTVAAGTAWASLAPFMLYGPRYEEVPRLSRRIFLKRALGGNGAICVGYLPCPPELPPHLIIFSGRGREEFITHTSRGRTGHGAHVTALGPQGVTGEAAQAERSPQEPHVTPSPGRPGRSLRFDE